MTIDVAVLTTDSLVLASDSATTQQLQTADGGLRTSSIWNSADKIVNLRKTWPIGVMTFGRATFAGRSIATHLKDLRCELSGYAEGTELAESTYTIGDDYDFPYSQIAGFVAEFCSIGGNVTKRLWPPLGEEDYLRILRGPVATAVVVCREP